MSPPLRSGSQTSRETVNEAAVKGLFPSVSAPADRGDSDPGSVAVDVSEAQTSASWLQAQQQLAQERRSYEKRVIALERRLRQVLSELQVTRCQLAEALTTQDYRGRQVSPLDVGSESSVSLVSSTMDAMLSTASVGSDSASEARSSASVSPTSTCTVVYRSKRRPDTRSSISSTSVDASDAFASACTVLDSAVKVLPQDKKLLAPHPPRPTPKLLTPSTSMLDITVAESRPETRQAQARDKAPQQQQHRAATESSSESSFVSSVSESESSVSVRKRPPPPPSSSWTQSSAKWLREMHRLVQVLRTAPQQPHSSDQTTQAPESVPSSSEEPSDATGKRSVAVVTSTEQQPVPTASSEVSSTEIKTSGRSLLSRMVNALLSSSSTTESVLETRASDEVSKAHSDAVVPSTAEIEHTKDKQDTPTLSSDHSDHACSVPPTEETAAGKGLLSRVVNALLPSSSTAVASVSQTRTGGEDSKAGSQEAISSPAEVEHPDRKRSTNAIVSSVSCMLGLSADRRGPAAPEQSAEAAPLPRHWLLALADRLLPATTPPQQPAS
ncbi:uncharacterized protein LOC126355558 [Schistocerca gregaria]|uniref:uncharacterized protein LOC126355558 n=1 Tax=Schistocerca gregaria TaxID=7010 RepID=UPI00211E1F56|nr:uncharacterized protein LOC126355558 [Schistocerca gregaria]